MIHGEIYDKLSEFIRVTALLIRFATRRCTNLSGIVYSSKILLVPFFQTRCGLIFFQLL